MGHPRGNRPLRQPNFTSSCSKIPVDIPVGNIMRSTADGQPAQCAQSMENMPDQRPQIPVLEIQSGVKIFGLLSANDHVSFAVRAGEIHAASATSSAKGTISQL